MNETKKELSQLQAIVKAGQKELERCKAEGDGMREEVSDETRRCAGIGVGVDDGLQCVVEHGHQAAPAKGSARTGGRATARCRAGTAVGSSTTSTR